MTESRFKLEVRPVIPEKLQNIEALASDLLYSWDRGVRGLFYRLDSELWEACNHNPKVFLRRVAQQKLDNAVEDNVFMEEFNRVMSVYETYHEKIEHPNIEASLDLGHDLIAYFCAEFGFHESFPIYSGGLGILAGDYCKAASDLGLPFVAVGLLYRQGYFTQTIDASGHQLAHYYSVDFNDLLIQPAINRDGEEVKVQVDISDRTVTAKVWEAKAGHIELYLLDTDVEENSAEDRSITFQLYGGDKSTRIQQEMILGIGGVRALRALGIEPTVWHINEGHAAFQILERCRELVNDEMDFNSSLELVASGTVFTTHTPVAAGHDIFDRELIIEYFSNYVHELRLGMEDFLGRGVTPGEHDSFNMTALALRGSRFHNGVSRIHGGVASSMEGYIWPQIPADENPISYVTNGVHVPTFLAREWVNLFDMRFREWRKELLNNNYWSCIDTIPDHRFWSLRQELKSVMMEDVCKRCGIRFRRNGYSEAMLARVNQLAAKKDSNVLILGFARRFATYKRATLLFFDPDRLSRLLNDPDRPVLLIFAGKAHPNDIPGQQLIQKIHEYSLKPEFMGKIVLLEGYDMALARKLVAGVDVWINTPEYPMEASGTSGQKAAINGVVNLSVLDGWWGEGYDGENGWAIHPYGSNSGHTAQYKEEAQDLLDIIEHEIIPIFFSFGAQGYSSEWVKISKASMKSCIPRFNAKRMVVDYVEDYYSRARLKHKQLAHKNAQPARDLARWKEKIAHSWPGVHISRIDDADEYITSGETLPMRVSVWLNGLNEDDVAVECLIGTENLDGRFETMYKQRFTFLEEKEDRSIFELNLYPSHSGLSYYKIRIYPFHDLLSHPFETGYMYWV